MSNSGIILYAEHNFKETSKSYKNYIESHFVTQDNKPSNATVTRDVLMSSSCTNIFNMESHKIGRLPPPPPPEIIPIPTL